MAAYVISEVEVTDPTKFQQYIDVVPATVAAYGGKYIVRAGASETLESNRKLGQFVIIEFESVARAKEWWMSKEYTAAKEVRQASANTNIIIVEGV